jgi:hypothetical protein
MHNTPNKPNRRPRLAAAALGLLAAILIPVAVYAACNVNFVVYESVSITGPDRLCVGSEAEFTVTVTTRTFVEGGTNVTVDISIADGSDGEVSGLPGSLIIHVPQGGSGTGTFPLTGVLATSASDKRVTLVATLNGYHIAEPDEAEGANDCVDTHAFVVYKLDMKITPKGAADYEHLPDPIQIAAGGFSSPAHQADVLIQVEPALPGVSIALGLLNGVGHERHARLEIGGQTADAGGDVIVVETDSSGGLQGVLTSSDSIDTCTVHASVVDAACEISKSVSFNWIWIDAFDSETDWVIEPAWIDDVGIYTNTLRIRHHRAQQPDAPVLPLDQHVIRLFVEKVVYIDDEGEEQVIINTADEPSDEVDEWAVFISAGTTDSAGYATVYLDIKKVDGLVELEFILYDWSVYRSPPPPVSQASDPDEPSPMNALTLDSEGCSGNISSPKNNLRAIMPFIALAPDFVPVVPIWSGTISWHQLAGHLNHEPGGFMVIYMMRRLNSIDISVQFAMLQGDSWVPVGSEYVRFHTVGEPISASFPYWQIAESDTLGRNRFQRGIIVARKPGKYRLAVFINGINRPQAVHQFEAVEGLLVPEGETAQQPLLGTITSPDYVEVPCHVFPVFSPTQQQEAFKVKYRLEGNNQSNYTLSLANVVSQSGSFHFEQQSLVEQIIWSTQEAEQEHYNAFGLKSNGYTARGVSAEGEIIVVEAPAPVVRLGRTSRRRLIAADMKIAKPTGATPHIGELGAGANPENTPLFVFDKESAGKCIARCEAAPLDGLSPASRALVWSLLEWKLPNVGPVEPGEGEREGAVTTFTYGSMPTHTDQFGNKNITLCFKDRETWAYHQPIQFRYNRKGTRAAAAALAAGTISANYAAAGNPNWYVYWQQVANLFENDVSGKFGPQTTMIYVDEIPPADVYGMTKMGEYSFDRLNIAAYEVVGPARERIKVYATCSQSAETSSTGADATYDPGYVTPTEWPDVITMYKNTGSSILDFVVALHHENGHRHSYQLPPEKGGFGEGLNWSLAADQDRDLINDEWESPGGAGYELGFRVEPEAEESRLLNVKWRSNWTHGWYSATQVKNPPPSPPGPYSNEDGYDPATGSGLTVRNEKQVNDQAPTIRKKDWSHHVAP